MKSLRETQRENLDKRKWIRERMKVLGGYRDEQGRVHRYKGIQLGRGRSDRW